MKNKSLLKTLATLWMNRSAEKILLNFKQKDKNAIVGLKRPNEDNFIYMIKLILSPRVRDETIVKYFEKNIYAKNQFTYETYVPEMHSYTPFRFRNKKQYIDNLYNNWDKYKNYSTMKDLMSIPGVGRKIASIYLWDIYGTNHIAIDTHCFQAIKKIWNFETTDQVKAEKFIFDNINFDEYKYKKELNIHTLLYLMNKHSYNSTLFSKITKILNLPKTKISYE